MVDYVNWYHVEVALPANPISNVKTHYLDRMLIERIYVAVVQNSLIMTACTLGILGGSCNLHGAD